MSGLRTFRLDISEGALLDLRERLSRMRYPDEPPLPPWSTGASLGYLKGLVEYWKTHFNWREWEAKLNSFGQYTLAIEGIELHFLHLPGRLKNAPPLLISHGWPSTVLDFYKIIPVLTEQFTVVAPSMPGFPLSFQPGQRRFGVTEIASLYANLMTALGYDKFSVHGGDWGAFVASAMALRDPGRIRGIHLTLLAMRRDRSSAEGLSDSEEGYFAELDHFLKEEVAYQMIQGTKPQTLASALTDSPGGLAAWIIEKVHAWSDHDGNLESAISRDEVLANISLYWFTGAIGSSFWPYFDRLHGPWPIPEGETINVPVGYAEFPREILRPPRSLAIKTYTDIRRWTPMSKGGHFAALEQPTLLANDILAFFDQLT